MILFSREEPWTAVITSHKWERDLKNVKIRKEDMNRIVMNFFVAEGYVDAAENFQKESGTKPEVDFASITDRLAVNKAIQCGNIEEAAQILNGLNPEILKTNFHLQQQRVIELIRQGKTEEALKFAEDVLTPFGEENNAILNELEDTMCLLVFGDLSTCQPKELLDRSQWLKIASEVNAAIITSQIGEKGPKLEQMLKMLIWNQNQMDEKAAYPHMSDLSTCQLIDPLE